MNKKIILIAASIFVLVAGIVVPIFGLKYFRRPRTQASPKNEPEQVRLSEVTSQSATITWTTASPAYGFISYGETMSLGKTSQEAEKVAEHSVTLSGLTPETTYYYKIGVGEDLFDDQGIPYSFTTPSLSSEQTTSEEEAQAPSETEPTIEGFETAMGTANPLYDLNGDGKVDATDISLFLAQKEASPSVSQE